MLIGLKLLASGALEAALRGISAAAKWLFADWRHRVLAAETAVLVWLWLFTMPGLRADIVQRDNAIVTVTLERDAEAAAHLGTVNAFLAASRQAQAEAEANVVRVEREQEIITDEVVSNHRSDLAALRQRFDRLRARNAAAVDPGNADQAGLPVFPAAPGGADAAPGEDRLSPAGWLTAEDALIASEQALQLDALIDWIEGQAAVGFNPEPAQ